MDATEASRVIESLRYGLPPEGHICHFTVGRQDEIAALCKQLDDDRSNVLLLNANYGAGKTHLLRFVREEALRKGWMVSVVSMDSKSGVRFDQLSQVIGAVCRGIEIPNRAGKGVRCLLDGFDNSIMTGSLSEEVWPELHHDGKWDQKKVFETEAFYLGLRAWIKCPKDVGDYIVNWFENPHMNSDGRPSHLYKLLVDGMRRFYRDARPKGYFTKERLDLTRNDDLCWAFLRDLHLAAKAMMLRGFVLCLDEFEDVLYNLPRIDAKKKAFWNLFELFHGHQYKANAYFAVTPGFVQKCKQELARKGEYDYDFSQFDLLRQFEMTPIERDDIATLCERIVEAHSVAFSWNPSARCRNAISKKVESFSSDASQDRVRQFIRHVVQELDRSLDA
ncbi:MAG: ATP-binding protein [Candidatus Hydrogenedentes bacterium]|nr:ATP-binding protein [Candidatus Hydrogenedentota bacterium]